MRGAPKSIRNCRGITSSKYERGSAIEDRGGGEEPAQPRGNERRGRDRHGRKRRLRRHASDVGEIQRAGWPEGDRSRDVPDFRVPDGDRGRECRHGNARRKNRGGSAVDVGRRTSGTTRAVAAGKDSLRAISRGRASVGLEWRTAIRE